MRSESLETTIEEELIIKKQRNKNVRLTKQKKKL